MRTAHEIAAYLTQAYGAGELLRDFAHWEPRLAIHLPNHGITVELADQIVAALGRWGALGDGFFDMLERTRPRRPEPPRLRAAMAQQRALTSPRLAPYELSLSEEVEHFLVDAFDSSELVRFASVAPGAPLVAHVLDARAPVARLPRRLVTLWKVEELLGPGLFARLEAERPRRQAEVAHLVAIANAREEALSASRQATLLEHLSHVVRCLTEADTGRYYPGPTRTAHRTRGPPVAGAGPVVGAARACCLGGGGGQRSDASASPRISNHIYGSSSRGAHRDLAGTLSPRASGAPLPLLRRKDLQAVYPLRDALVREGYDVFVAKSRIEPTADWRGHLAP